MPPTSRPALRLLGPLRRRRLRRAPTVLLTLACAAPAAAGAAQITPVPAGAGAYGRPWGGALNAELQAAGYREREYVLAGTATTFAREGKWGRDGRWAVRSRNQKRPFATRVVVRWPSDPKAFNGTAVVEWNNVSAQFDTSPDWGQSASTFLRDGYAWVGVSTQVAGIRALRLWDPRRYAQLNIGVDAYSYDVFTQVARALRDPASPLLGGLKPQQLLATGHSQSAGRLVTYANAVQPTSHAYDGILIHGRGSIAAPIDDTLQSTLSSPSDPAIRTDSAAPVLQLLSETDIDSIGPLRGYTLNQPDHHTLRTWQVAGTSHIDHYALSRLVPELSHTVGLPPSVIRDPSLVRCNTPQINTAPSHLVQNAAYDALRRWAAGGTPPPHAPFVTRTATGKIARDQFGNATGGIRLPDLQAPVARYSPSTKARRQWDLLAGAACGLFGGTTPLPPDKLAELYPTRATYLDAYRQATDALIASGFMLPVDRAQALSTAEVRALP